MIRTDGMCSVKSAEAAWNYKSGRYSIQILTAHEGNGGKLLSRGETQPWPTIHRGP